MATPLERGTEGTTIVLILLLLSTAETAILKTWKSECFLFYVFYYLQLADVQHFQMENNQPICLTSVYTFLPHQNSCTYIHRKTTQFWHS